MTFYFIIDRVGLCTFFTWCDRFGLSVDLSARDLHTQESELSHASTEVVLSADESTSLNRERVLLQSLTLVTRGSSIRSDADSGASPL